jgi:hypothetical protein
MRRPPITVSVSVLVAIVVSLVSCDLGSDAEDPGSTTKDDNSTVEAIMFSNASVQGAMQPLYGCVPEVLRCYTKAGPEAASVIEGELERYERVATGTDNPCLADVADLYGESLDAYLQAARAASRGDPAAFDDAIARSTELEKAYADKLAECGFAQGKLAEFNRKANEIGFAIIELSDEVYACSDRDCVVSGSRRLEEKAREGIALLDEYSDDLSEGAPDCYPEILDQMREMFVAFGALAVAIQEGDRPTIRREAKHAAKLGVTVQEDAATCVSSVMP